MISTRASSDAHPWLNNTLWITSAVAGFVSIALALSVLLDPEFAESGVSIFHVCSSLSSSQLLLMNEVQFLRSPRYAASL